ncbi:MAG: nuclear transport factor 2 family protein [Anaerolineales bacterium]
MSDQTTVKRDAFENWVLRYIKAWKTNAREDIEALFTEDATYLTQAFREPWRGLSEIVEGWLSRADTQGEWSFEHKWLAIEGDTGVLEGLTTYHTYGTAYANIWTIVLAEDGRCREFREYWVKKPEENS